MTDAVQIEMPVYQCHKQVHALKIRTVTKTEDGSVVLTFSELGYAPRTLSQVWADKHEPEAGGYYVAYEDGYTSYSPAAAFEGGYTRV